MIAASTTPPHRSTAHIAAKALCIATAALAAITLGPKAAKAAFTADTQQAQHTRLAQNMYADWAKGKLVEKFDQYFTPNLVLDAAPHGPANLDFNFYDPRFKLYQGKEGFKEWTAFTSSTYDYSTFKVEGVASPDQDTTLVEISWVPTLLTGKSYNKRVYEIHEWTLKNGKVASLRWFANSPGALEALTSKSPKDIVLACFGQWAKGFNATNAAALFTADYVFDFAPMPGCPAAKNRVFSVFHGIEGVLEWQSLTSTWDWSSFKMEGVESISETEALVKVSYVPTLKSGKTTGKRVTDLQLWTVSNGKAKSFKIFFSDFPALNDLY